MSAGAGSFDASPVNRDLSAWTRRSPAEQDVARGGDPDGPVKTYYEDVIKTPGMDFRPERCKGLQPVGFCEESGHPVLGTSSCGNRGCPKHWRGDWLRRAVQAQVARLAAYRHSQRGKGRRMLHVAVSPPQDRYWTSERFWNTRSRSYDVARDCGVRGGTTIAHPYRPSDAGDRLFETAVEHGDWPEERGKWSLFADVADGDWSEYQHYIEGGPHYHMLAAAEWLESEAAPDGWVVKNLRSMGRFHIDDVESYRPMARAAYYVLTHAGAQKGRQTTTYFGAVHPSNFDPEAELEDGEWARIQEMTERAMSTAPGGVERESGIGALECPHDGCESAVVPLDELSDWMDDDDWFSGLDGRERNQLRSLEAWIVLGIDRPPPGPRRDRERLLVWLTERGAVLTDADRSPTGAGTSPGLLGDFSADLKGLRGVPSGSAD